MPKGKKNTTQFLRKNISQMTTHPTVQPGSADRAANSQRLLETPVPVINTGYLPLLQY